MHICIFVTLQMDGNSYQCVGNLEGLTGSKHLDTGLSSHLVTYIHSEDYLSHCNRFWKVAGRVSCLFVRNVIFSCFYTHCRLIEIEN